MSNKYTIVGFVGRSNPPQTFSETDWPLHVTLLDPFKTEWSQEQLIAEVEKFALTANQFPLILSKRSALGPNKDVPVMLLEIDENIRQHHSQLLDLGRRGSFVYNTPEFVGDGFVPHITDADGERAELDEHYDLVTISIVDTTPGGDASQRAIITTFELAPKRPFGIMQV